MGTAHEEEEEKDGDVTNGQKVELIEKIKKLSNSQLTEMVAFVKEMQESAYLDPDGTGDRVQIKINDLTKDSFLRLKDKVENWMSGEPAAKRQKTTA